jgi:AraC-like DNA-binding protein
MLVPLGAPFLGNQTPDLGAPVNPQGKSGRVIAQGGRASTTAPGCFSSTEKTNKDTARNGSSTPEPFRIMKARIFIDAHFSDELSLREVARAAHISTNYFSEKFKEATGENFVKYVARLRFEKALVLLRQPNLRVSEIAFAIGFQSLSQFNRVFKKLAGQSPTALRAAAEDKRK